MVSDDEMNEYYKDALEKFSYIWRWRWYLPTNITNQMVHYMNELYDKYGSDD